MPVCFRLIVGLLSLIGTAGVAHGEPPSPAAIKSFGAWTGTCNNIGTCVAIGTTDASGFFYVRIEREAGATAAPAIKLVLLSQDPLKGAMPAFALKAGDVALGPYAAKAQADGATQYEAELSGDREIAGFVEVVRNADHVDFSLLSASGTLDLKGLAATLRWIDAQQGRAGTPTALVARGMTPIGQVPQARPMPIVTAARAGPIEAIAKPTFGKELLAKATSIAECDAETIKANETGAAWRLGPDTMLWAISCIAGAYNFSDALFVSDANGANIRSVALPPPPGVEANSAPNIVTNTNFDPKTLVLSEFGKDRGIGDCGDLREWVWTGASFALLEASQLNACPGALAEDWPNIYKAQRSDPK